MHDAGQAHFLPSYLMIEQRNERERLRSAAVGEAVSGDSSHANENQMAHLLSLGASMYAILTERRVGEWMESKKNYT